MTAGLLGTMAAKQALIKYTCGHTCGFFVSNMEVWTMIILVRFREFSFYLSDLTLDLICWEYCEVWKLC